MHCVSLQCHFPNKEIETFTKGDADKSDADRMWRSLIEVLEVSVLVDW